MFALDSADDTRIRHSKSLSELSLSVTPKGSFNKSLELVKCEHL